MKYLSLIFVMFALTACASCSKSDSTGSSSGAAPTNLTVTATVSTDNSGNVAFTASATNAVSYDYDFGNGIFQTTTTGGLSYRYLTSGTYTVNVIAKSSSGQIVSKSVNITVTVTLSLLWSDEFNVAGAPDPAKWGYDLGGGGWGNNELEYYTSRPDNAIVSGGTLKIKALKESFSGSSYTSARLLSKGKFSFKYGKVEFSAKLPTGVGTWPALWALGNAIDTDGWPNCGEIDIMEGKGSEPNKIYGTLHYPGHSGANGNGNTTTITGASTGFHKYSLEWSPTALKIAVDDVPFHTIANTASLPFNANFFLIMNLAIGGNFAGPVDPTFTGGTMEVDYVRVYQ